ncbi:EAL domain-containing protein [Leptospira noguchii]|nr:EAL domain-containing protein [Leptospira noguchii]EMO87917.1 EAL-domain associated signaling protein domain protein [Leptospira noguchii str. 2001034031]EQA70103.1 EAL-domain associated signaling protein domain protein [Leptospira noguchii serovar Panama str. CZ214]MCH1910753.1 EAL domain-containing protein [Leptospira noguchii]MCH1917115.1 EAL domain-containing protein [Leptospira noguchii]UOG62850.1 EAL domain-containing protein [Leptospira noguchii]
MIGISPKTKLEWDLWFQSGEVVPFFQPILSVERDSIFGYETLGRFRDQSGKIHSLGPFFLNALSGVEDLQERKEIYFLKRDIDRSIRKKALFHLLKNQNRFPEAKLFVNISPAYMRDHIEEEEIDPYTIRLVKEFGLDPSKIVIEIVEEHFDGSIESLRPLISRYKEEGFLVAIDDLGSRSSNLDRIGIFHPDILKVDLQMLRHSVVSRNFQEILFTISRLSESLGCSLLFEGIENDTELFQSLTYSARFLQGFYFAEALPNMVGQEELKLRFSAVHECFLNHKRNQLVKRIQLEKELEEKLDLSGIIVNTEEELCSIQIQSPNLLRDFVFRIYVTNLIGSQVSPNYMKIENTSIDIDPSFVGRNWSWRPYFLEQLYKSMKDSRAGWIISNPYYDISYGTLLVTYSKKISEQNVLFVDAQVLEY